MGRQHWANFYSNLQSTLRLPRETQGPTESTVRASPGVLIWKLLSAEHFLFLFRK